MKTHNGTCDRFILPQIKDREKGLFPFNVTQKNIRRVNDGPFGTFPPSTHLRSEYHDEESYLDDIRYIRSIFDTVQGFIENMGK